MEWLVFGFLVTIILAYHIYDIHSYNKQRKKLLSEIQMHRMEIERIKSIGQISPEYESWGVGDGRKL